MATGLGADESNTDGAKYGYGILEVPHRGNRVYFHNGEIPGFNSIIAHDPVNHMNMVVWANLPVNVDKLLPADTIMRSLLSSIYAPQK